MTCRYWFGLLAVVLAPPFALAQVPAATEFQVNTYTTLNELQPSVAIDRTGQSVVAWAGPDADGLGIFARLFSAAGTPFGPEFQVNADASGAQYHAAVAWQAGGDFIVVWTGTGLGDPDVAVFGRRFDSAGSPRGTEFRVNTYTTHFQHQPSLAVGPDGSFLVVWSSVIQDGVDDGGCGQRYDRTGTPVGGEFEVNTYTTSRQIRPSVAADRLGRLVVVWESYVGPGRQVRGRRYDSGGVPQTDEFQVSPTNGYEPHVATATTGEFVVVWTDNDGDGLGVFVRRFDAAGLPIGAESLVNTVTATVQRAPSVAAGANGDFVVAWHSLGQDGGGISPYGIFGQRFSRSGQRRGSEFQINTYTTSSQRDPAVASDPEGNFVVSWSSLYEDGSGFGVFAQRFGGLLPAALAVDTVGNRVFEPGESVDVRPSWRNVNGTAQTLAGTVVAFTGPFLATYTIVDGTADYGIVANGATTECLECYRVAVTSMTRPALHWDAVLEEKAVPDVQGQDKLWRLHLGGSFTDVPTSSGFYRFVETLLHNSITAGCRRTEYCPAGSTAREQMAVFVLVGKEGAGYRPPSCTTAVFPDVPASSPFCPFIEELARRGVVSGCGGGNYCPADAVTREQMPVFVLRTLDPALDPPACSTPVFADVPASSPFCRWIEELARRGVVTGCGGGNYCPADPVTREQMSVFISATFGLVLYGP